MNAQQALADLRRDASVQAGEIASEIRYQLQFAASRKAAQNAASSVLRARFARAVDDLANGGS